MTTQWIKATVATWVFWMASTTAAFAHEEHSRVALQLASPSVSQAGEVNLRFRLKDGETGAMLGDSDLAIQHEKKLHVFVFDASLKEFRHEHPVFDGDAWSLSASLPVSGHYRIWAQGQIAADAEEFTSGEQFDVQGGAPANPLPPSLEESRSGADGLSQVTVSGQKIIAGRMTMLDVVFSRGDGSSPQITPFLGALAHVVAVPADGASLVHVHPMDHGVPNQLMLHTVFEEPGEYRLWIQFIDAGELKTVPLSVRVRARRG